jgi:hypothetical protein
MEARSDEEVAYLLRWKIDDSSIQIRAILLLLAGASPTDRLPGWAESRWG